MQINIERTDCNSHPMEHRKLPTNLPAPWESHNTDRIDPLGYSPAQKAQTQYLREPCGTFSRITRESGKPLADVGGNALLVGGGDAGGGERLVNIHSAADRV